MSVIPPLSPGSSAITRALAAFFSLQSCGSSVDRRATKPFTLQGAVLRGSHTSDSESLSRAVSRAPQPPHTLFLAAVEVSESSCLYFQRDGEPRRLAAWLLAPMLSPIPTPSPSPIPHAITRSMMLSSQGNDCSLGTTHEPEPA